MLGDVSLVQKDAKVNGARLVIDLDSGRAVMDGGGPPGTTRQGGRVTGTFTVPQKKGG
jgi:lipopolysaccharide export system protein LptA